MQLLGEPFDVLVDGTVEQLPHIGRYLEKTRWSRDRSMYCAVSSTTRQNVDVP